MVTCPLKIVVRRGMKRNEGLGCSPTLRKIESMSKPRRDRAIRERKEKKGWGGCSNSLKEKPTEFARSGSRMILIRPCHYRYHRYIPICSCFCLKLRLRQHTLETLDSSFTMASGSSGASGSRREGRAAQRISTKDIISKNNMDKRSFYEGDELKKVAEADKLRKQFRSHNDQISNLKKRLKYHEERRHVMARIQKMRRVQC